jgi:hypothetical protein
VYSSLHQGNIQYPRSIFLTRNELRSLSDLGIWLAASSLMMLTVAELTSPFYASRRGVSFSRKKIRRIAIAFAMAFVAVALIRITFIIS